MPYRVILTVKESKGNCPYYRIGDKITYEEPEIIKEKSGGLCLYALLSLAPYLACMHANLVLPDLSKLLNFHLQISFLTFQLLKVCPSSRVLCVNGCFGSPCASKFLQKSKERFLFNKSVANPNSEVALSSISCSCSAHSDLHDLHATSG